MVRTAEAKPWCEVAIASLIVPSLAVPETASYNLRAKVIPNQVLLQTMKALRPQSSMSHRRILRAILHEAPSLSYHYFQHLGHGAISLAGNEKAGDFSVMASLDVVLAALEAPLPACFDRGVLCPEEAAEEGEERDTDSFTITPVYAADLLLPSFLGGALSTFLKSDNMLVVMQGYSVIALVLKRLRLAISRLRKIDFRQQSLSNESSGLAGFLAVLRMKISQRLPNPGVFLYSAKLADAVLLPDEATSPTTSSLSIARHTHLRASSAPPQRKAFLFRFERMLLTLRLLQEEVPGYMAGVSMVKALFPEKLPEADHARRAQSLRGCGSDAAASALLLLIPAAVLMLLQLLSHDRALRPAALLTSRDVLPAGGGSPSAPLRSSPLAEVLLYHVNLTAFQANPGTDLDDEDTADLLRLQRECVSLLQALLQSVLVTPSVEGSVSPAELEAWVGSLRSLGDCVDFSNAVNQVLNDVCAEKRPFAEESLRSAAERAALPHSPLHRLVEKEAEKQAGVAELFNRFKQRFSGAAAAASKAEAVASSHDSRRKGMPQWGLPSAAPPLTYKGSDVVSWVLGDGEEGCHDSLTRILSQKFDVLQQGDEDGDVIGAEGAATSSPLARYKGTLSEEDQALYAVIKKEKLLEKNSYRLVEPGAGAGFDVGYPIRLATKLIGEKQMQYTLQNYPRQLPDGEDEALFVDPDMVDPRHFTEAVAAHLSVCASRDPVLVPELRRYSLSGITPFLIKGLSSHITSVRRDAYTSLACLREVAPQNTPFYMLLTHIKNSCWEPFARLPVSLTAFLAAASEAVFNKTTGFSGRAAGGTSSGMTQSVLANVTRYLLMFPYTRRGDIPFAEALVRPVAKGHYVGVQLFVVAVVTNMLGSMRHGGICGHTAGALASGAVFPNAMSVIQNPLSSDGLREQAARMLESAASVLPSVLLAKLRLIPQLAHATVSLRQTATGDLRTVIVSKLWALRTRLTSIISLVLLNTEEEKRHVAHLLPDYTSAYTQLLLYFLGLGDAVTANAAAFAPICLVTLGVLAREIVSIMAHTYATSGGVKAALEAALLPMPLKDLSARMMALCRAHTVTGAAPAMPHARALLHLLETEPAAVAERLAKNPKPRRVEGVAEQSTPRQKEEKGKEKRGKGKEGEKKRSRSAGGAEQQASKKARKGSDPKEEGKGKKEKKEKKARKN
eukprot:TRINITY_DN6108_c0_g2_i1.p1 TRINITY_DN6108_c0_g2~~TRINITY_DN6108_c0_g2_i1.p1  ORF type:complete len:1200 (+),score=480.23 TRINITY_DN6108_c0_g2_i1:45-3602(+)